MYKEQILRHLNIRISVTLHDPCFELGTSEQSKEWILDTGKILDLLLNRQAFFIHNRLAILHTICIIYY